MTAILGLVWGKLRGWVVAAFAILATLGYVFLRGRSSAKGDAQLEQAKERSERNANATNEVVKASTERANIDAEISSISGSDALERLRKSWSRD